MKIINILNRLYEAIDDSITKYNLSNHKAYIWGVSRASYAGLQYYAHKGIDVAGVIDNNPDLQGDLPERFDGYCEWEKAYKVPVFYGEKISDMITGHEYFLVFSRFYNEICEQLESYGVDKEHIILIYNANDEMKLAYENLEIPNNARKLTVEEIKKIEFEILCSFAELCDRNNLRYYLAAGTLLGAIRHKGFIPWDDDVDVYMPITDYYVLIELVKEGKVSLPNMKFIYHGLTDNYSWRFMKVMRTDTVMYAVRWPLICYLGVNIDIFPVSGCPGTDKEMNDYYRGCLAVLSDWYKTYVGLGSVRNDADIDWMTKFKETFSKYDYEESPRVGMLLDGDPRKEVIDGPMARQYIDVEFEGRNFHAIKNYDEYLTASFGDYMTPPPVNCRGAGAHTVEAYIME